MSKGLEYCIVQILCRNLCNRCTQCSKTEVSNKVNITFFRMAGRTYELGCQKRMTSGMLEHLGLKVPTLIVPSIKKFPPMLVSSSISTSNLATDYHKVHHVTATHIRSTMRFPEKCPPRTEFSTQSQQRTSTSGARMQGKFNI